MRRFMFLVLVGTFLVGAFAGCSSMTHRTPDLNNMVVNFQYAAGTLDVTWYDTVARCVIRVDNGMFFTVDNSTKITIVRNNAVEEEATLIALREFEGRQGSICGYFIKEDPYHLATNVVVGLANTPHRTD